MQRLDLNLSTRPFRNNTLLWLGYGLAAFALVGFAAWNVTTFHRHGVLLDERRSQLEDLDSQQKDLERRERLAERERSEAELDLDMLTVQSMKANDVIEWKAFSWTELFNRLETVLPWNVHMVAVRPIFRAEQGRADTTPADVRSRPVAVEGYAKTLHALLDFERKLFASEFFDNPEPLRHAPDERGDTVFTMRFTYFPDGRPRRTVIEDEPAAAVADAAVAGQPADEPAARTAAPASQAAATPPPAAGDDTPSIVDDSEPAPAIPRARRKGDGEVRP